MNEIKKLQLMTRIDKMVEELGKIAYQLPGNLFSKANDICDELNSLQWKIEELVDENEDEPDDYEEMKLRELETWR